MGEGGGCEWMCDVGVHEGDGEGGGVGGDGGAGVPGLAWWPAVDGGVVVGDPTVVVGRGGLRADVPVMVGGNNSDEGFALSRYLIIGRRILRRRPS